MTNEIVVALDAMGGDVGIDTVLPAAKRMLAKRAELRFIIVGDEPRLRAHRSWAELEASGRVSLQHASQVVDMDELPAQALRGKKDSSMRVAINLVKQGQAQACVSAGNTGALMATAKFVLKTLPGIDRPAICTAIPSRQGQTHMLDLGANVDCTPAHLSQFAAMGSALVSAVHDIEKPRVGLLNIGSEEIKGTEQIKQAAAMLEQSALNYIGFVEADAVLGDCADVVVCDGFAGNVCLKASEGVASMISQYLKEEFKRGFWQKLCGLAAMPVLMSFRRRVDPRNYNGASFLGLQGTVVKSHGGADDVAFANAIEIAAIEVRHDVPSRIGTLLEHQFLETA